MHFSLLCKNQPTTKAVINKWKSERVTRSVRFELDIVIGPSTTTIEFIRYNTWTQAAIVIESTQLPILISILDAAKDSQRFVIFKKCEHCIALDKNYHKCSSSHRLFVCLLLFVLFLQGFSSLCLIWDLLALIYLELMKKKWSRKVHFIPVDAFVHRRGDHRLLYDMQGHVGKKKIHFSTRKKSSIFAQQPVLINRIKMTVKKLYKILLPFYLFVQNFVSIR